MSLELEIRHTSSQTHSLRLTVVTFRLFSEFGPEFSHDGKIEEKPDMGYPNIPSSGEEISSGTQNVAETSPRRRFRRLPESLHSELISNISPQVRSTWDISLHSRISESKTSIFSNQRARAVCKELDQRLSNGCHAIIASAVCRILSDRWATGPSEVQL